QLPKALPVRQRMIGQTVSYLESMARDAGDNPELLLDIAGSYDRVAEIQGGMGISNLGDTKGAIRSWQAASVLVDRALSGSKKSADAVRLAVRIHNSLGGLLIQGGSRSEGAAHLDQAVSLARQFQAGGPGEAKSLEIL